MPLPLSLQQLLHTEGVESVRLEFKESWNDVIQESVIPTICAFANDFQGLGGGYVVLGVAEDPEHKGRARLPPAGLGAADLDRLQQKVRVACKTWIEPEYQPIIAPREEDGRALLVLYAPPGDNRPYTAKDSAKSDRKYWVRIGSETVEARDSLRAQLLSASSRVSFDDRRRQDVPMEMISPGVLRRYLEDIGRELTESAAHLDVASVLRGMRLTSGTNGSECPRNAALLLFSDDPERFFPGARIDVAQFDEDGALVEERTFRGPLSSQIRDVVAHIESLSASVVEKIPTDVHAHRFVTWPVLALREAVVNAVLHRAYDVGASHPTRIKLFPDRVEITSYPGPVPGLFRRHLNPGAQMPGLPPRNPRVAELLKALRLAETWQTGLQKIRREMSRNGSGTPTFDFDDERTYFRVTLPAHPEYTALQTIQRAALLRIKGDIRLAYERVNATHAQQPASPALALTTIEYALELPDMNAARAAFKRYRDQTSAPFDRRIVMRWANALLDAGQPEEAALVLRDLQSNDDVDTVVNQAVLFKRAGDVERAHRYFQSIEAQIADDPRALGEYAGVKRALAGKLPRASGAPRALNREAEALLRRIVSLTGSSPLQKAWAWAHLAMVLRFEGRHAEATTAVEAARKLNWYDPKLVEELHRLHPRSRPTQR